MRDVMKKGMDYGWLLFQQRRFHATWVDTHYLPLPYSFGLYSLPSPNIAISPLTEGGRGPALLICSDGGSWRLHGQAMPLHILVGRGALWGPLRLANGGLGMGMDGNEWKMKGEMGMDCWKLDCNKVCIFINFI
jgi:hypothetical protein